MKKKNEKKNYLQQYHWTRDLFNKHEFRFVFDKSRRSESPWIGRGLTVFVFLLFVFVFFFLRVARFFCFIPLTWYRCVYSWRFVIHNILWNERIDFSRLITLAQYSQAHSQHYIHTQNGKKTLNRKKWLKYTKRKRKKNQNETTTEKLMKRTLCSNCLVHWLESNAFVSMNFVRWIAWRKRAQKARTQQSITCKIPNEIFNWIRTKNGAHTKKVKRSS